MAKAEATATPSTPGSVLVYSHSWIPGQVDGVAVRMMAHAKELAKRGSKVTVVTPDFVIDGKAPPESPLTGVRPEGMEHVLVQAQVVPVYRKNMCMRYSLANFRMLCNVIKRVRPEVVHATQEASLQLLAVACLLYDVPLLISMHTDINQIASRDAGFSFLGSGIIGRVHARLSILFVHWGYRNWCQAGATYFCVSKHAKTVLANAGVPKQTVVEHTWGPMVDRSTFRIDLPEMEVAQVRKELTLGIADAFVMTYVGRVTAEKDIQFLVDALSRAPKNVVFAIIGNGSMVPELKKLHGREHRIHCTGEFVSREKVALILRASDCCVSASTMETVGFTAMETLSCGTPMLAANAQGFAEHLSHGVNARLWTPMDANSFDQELAAMMATKREGTWTPEALRKSMDSASVEACTDRALLSYKAAKLAHNPLLTVPLAVCLLLLQWFFSFVVT